MRHRQNFPVFVARLISDRQRTGILDSQTMRYKWILNLDSLFTTASLMAKGTVEEKETIIKKESISAKERQLWAHVAAHTAEVMGNLTRGYDEQQFNEDLAELREQIDAIEKLQSENDEKDDRETESKSEG